jgi:hypothetical protein
MVKIEKIYTVRRRVLYGVFICSIIYFILFMVPPFLSARSPKLLDSNLFWIKLTYAWGIAMLLICFGLLVRYLHLRTYLKKNPSLRQAVDDERIRISWLKAFRFAFYLMLVIHSLWIFGFHGHSLKTQWPNVQWLSIAFIFPGLFGASLFFSRERRHE